MQIRYKRIKVKVDHKKPTICKCCGNTPKPRGMHMHHTKYEFTIDEVRKKPELALKNTIGLCYHCHRLANCMRILEENKEKYKKLKKILSINKE